MEAHVLPDVEALVIDWALATAEVNTVDDRIYGALPYFLAKAPPHPPHPPPPPSA